MAQPYDPNFIGPIFDLKPKVIVAPPAPLPSLKVVSSATNQQVLSPNFVGPVKPAPIAPRGTPATAVPPVPGVVQQGPGANLFQPTSTPKQLDLAKVAELRPGVVGINGTPAPLPYAPNEFRTGVGLTPEQRQTAFATVRGPDPLTLTPAQEQARRIASEANLGLTDRITRTFGSNPVTKTVNFLASGLDPYFKDIWAPAVVRQISDDVASGKIDSSVFAGMEALQKTNLQLVGDAAQAVLTVYTPALGTKLVVNSATKKLLETGLKELAIQGAKEGGFQGLQYGIAQALSSGSTNPDEIGKIILANTAGGLAIGGVLNTAIPALSKVIAATKQYQTTLVDKLISKGYSRTEAQRLATQGGWLGDIFDTPKVQQLRKQLEKSEALKQEALRNGKTQVANRHIKNIEDLNKKIRAEMQGGFVDLGADRKPKTGKLPQVSSQLQKAVPEGKTPHLQVDSKSPSYAKSIPEGEIYYNYDKLGISDQAKTAIRREVSDLTDVNNKILGEKLTHKEFVKRAASLSDGISKIISKDEQTEFIARALRTRQTLAEVGQRFEAGKATKEEFVDAFLKAKSATQLGGRYLESFKEVASPVQKTYIQRILDGLDKQGKLSDELLDKINKADWGNPEEITKLYRNEVKPTVREWVDLLRYNSMLSSPNTHLTNATSNLVGTAVLRPVMQTAYGVFDPIRAAITGTGRKQFAGEGAAYARGYASNVGKAWTNMIDTIRQGQGYFESVQQIPLTVKGTKGRMVENTLKSVSALLEGVDQFFKTMTEGGVTAQLKYRAKKGVPVDLDTVAEIAQKELFRNELGHESSRVLQAIDYLPRVIQDARRSENKIVNTISNLTFPFVRFAANASKAGVEYGPLGYSTLWGATNKYEQIIKASIGTATMVTTAAMVGADGVTGPQPTDEATKAAWKDAGRIPWSIKIGDKWVSYSRMHPAIAFNLGLLTSVKQGLEDGKITEDMSDVILKTVGKYMNFVADQSYLRNIGDLAAAGKGDKVALSKFFSNPQQQFIPFRALSSWIARIVDPYERQIDPTGTFLDKQAEAFLLQIPWASKKLDVRLDNAGQPIEKNNRILNAFSPASISTEDNAAEGVLQRREALGKYNKQAGLENDKVKREAQQYLAKSKTMSVEERQHTFQALKPDVQEEFTNQLLANVKGLDAFEKSFQAARIEARAQFLYKETKNMNPQERTELITNLAAKGLLTDKVLEELAAIVITNK